MTHAQFLQSHLNQLMANAQAFQQVLQQKAAEYEQVGKQIEQHKGALAYNDMLVKGAQKQLADLAAAETETKIPTSL